MVPSAKHGHTCQTHWGHWQGRGRSLQQLRPNFKTSQQHSLHVRPLHNRDFDAGDTPDPPTGATAAPASPIVAAGGGMQQWCAGTCVQWWQRQWSMPFLPWLPPGRCLVQQQAPKHTPPERSPHLLHKCVGPVWAAHNGPHLPPPCYGCHLVHLMAYWILGITHLLLLGWIKTIDTIANMACGAGNCKLARRYNRTLCLCFVLSIVPNLLFRRTTLGGSCSTSGLTSASRPQQRGSCTSTPCAMPWMASLPPWGNHSQSWGGGRNQMPHPVCDARHAWWCCTSPSLVDSGR